MLAFLVLWVAVFAICSIVVGAFELLDGNSNIVRRTAKAGVGVATGVTAVGIVVRLAVLALNHIFV